MNNKADFQTFFKTDNSSKTNLHYDLVASKFMTGIENHQRKQYYSSESNSAIILLIGAIFQIAFGLVVFIVSSVFQLFKSSK
jgi:hypothetical protein